MKVSVIGLGYVGMSLASACADQGWDVVGYDTNSNLITELRFGRINKQSISKRNFSKILSLRFLVTDDAKMMLGSAVFIICVPTPLDHSGRPDLGAITMAGENLKSIIGQGSLIILESTSFPGTTDEILKPILESNNLKSGKDFYLAFSSERIDPGNSIYGLENTPKVVGADDEESLQKAVDFYQKICSSVVAAKGTREAELSKLIENSYRNINIAFMNELLQVSHEAGWDIWNAIDCASTKPFGFQSFYPGPGVGGHCIPVDPIYLMEKVNQYRKSSNSVLESAIKVNSEMPNYVANRIQEILKSSTTPSKVGKILLLGITYKRDVDDIRESPSLQLCKYLLKMKLSVGYHDPLFPNLEFTNETDTGPVLIKLSSQDLSNDCLDYYDLVVVMQNHSDIDIGFVLKHARRILDTRGKLKGPNVISL